METLTATSQERRIILISIGVMVNLLILGITVLAILNRTIPDVMALMASNVATALSTMALTILGYKPTQNDRRNGTNVAA